MRRVVITGLGIISSIGNNKQEVLTSLKSGKSGVEFCPEYKELGLNCQIHGSVDIDISQHIDKRYLRFMGDGASYTYIAMKEAIKDAGLKKEQVSNERTGLIAGSGGPSTKSQVWAADILRQKGIKRVGPFVVTKAMSSTISATLATPFEIKGVSYSITSACATSAHCIGNAMETIQMGKQDIIFAGGGEELDWTITMLFDAMKALSTKYNKTPETASRPFDKSQDGFVIAGGAGMVVLEEYEHAKSRGAKIYAELTGYGATSDGYSMVQPSGHGAIRCMRQALSTARGEIDYINAHGTSTPIGDSSELKSIKEVFGAKAPKISSTKSLTGHSLGGTGVQETIYSLLMMDNNFIAGSANISELVDEAQGLDIVKKVEIGTNVDGVLSNNFGFGGTNASLIFEKL